MTSRPSTYLVFKESILQGLVPRVAACTLKQQLVLLAREVWWKSMNNQGVLLGMGQGLGGNMPAPQSVARTLTG